MTVYLDGVRFRRRPWLEFGSDGVFGWSLVMVAYFEGV